MTGSVYLGPMLICIIFISTRLAGKVSCTLFHWGGAWA